jgi:hypothetical protein
VIGVGSTGYNTCSGARWKEARVEDDWESMGRSVKGEECDWSRGETWR